MGSVYRAADARLGRKCAVKMLAHELADTERMRRRFLEEARAMGGLRHENVAQVYSYGDHHGEPYIVMEYVRGQTVADLIYGDAVTAPGLDADLAVGIVDQIARGMSAIHSAGIIHGDIKPTNVLLDEKQRAVVVDFGLMRWLGDLEDMSIVVGTPAYIPPEVVKADSIELRLTPAADVFALGVMAFEMFTGRLPFPVSTVEELFEAHLGGMRAPALSELRPDVSPLYDEVFERVLSEDLRARYRSADDFRRALLAVRAAAAASASPLGVAIANPDEAEATRMSVVLEDAIPGCVACTSHTGEHLVSLVQREPIDLVLFDPALAGDDPHTLFYRLQATRAGHRLVVVGALGADDARVYDELGAAACLTAPLDDVALVAAVRHVAGRS